MDEMPFALVGRVGPNKCALDGGPDPMVRGKFGGNRARQLYKNISMLFLFPVKDGKLSTGVIAIFNASCYG